jgi:hypothetical protein
LIGNQADPPTVTSLQEPGCEIQIAYYGSTFPTRPAIILHLHDETIGTFRSDRLLKGQFGQIPSEAFGDQERLDQHGGWVPVTFRIMENHR